MSPQTGAAVWQPESPFVDAPTFESVPAPTPSPDGATTPFLSEYFAGEVSVPVAPESEELLELVHELHDEAFDGAMAELADAAAVAADAAGTGPGEREAFVRSYLAPLRREAERRIDAASAIAGDRDASMLTEGELEGVFASADPMAAAGLSPLFEDFLGGLINKVKSVAKKGLDIAKKVAGSILPIGIILGKLKGLVKPLLERVLKFALGKLPPALRPMASQLARRLLGRVGFEAVAEAAELEQAYPATADVSAIQQEFDLAAASLLFTDDPMEGEVAIGELTSAAEAEESDAVERLEAARERFAAEITALEPGADPQPVIEGFLPAVLPLVKTGIGLIGRQRVVNFLARHLAKLIVRYVGQQGATALSRAIVDAGLRLVHLEAPDERETAGSALAATVEDTVRRLGELDELALEDEALFEDAVYEAFESAAAANLPPALLKPEVRETAGVDGMWTLLPAAGAKGCKRYTRRLETTITPQIARRVTSWGGVPLADALRARYELEGPVHAVADLYEAIPGTRLGRIGANLHPLTTEAAGLLFREPGLGRDVGESFEEDPTYVATGQRFFALEVPAARPVPVRGRPSQTRAMFNLRAAKREIRLAIYFSERDAQEIAARINAGADPATVATAVIGPARARLARILGGRAGGALRAVGEDELSPRRFNATFRRGLRALASSAPRVLRSLKPAEWAQKAILAKAGFASEFAAAAASQRDGVTVVVTFSQVPGLDALGQALRQGEPSPQRLRGLTLGEPGAVTVQVVAGEQR